MVRQQFLIGATFLKLLKILFKKKINITYYKDIIRLLKVSIFSTIYSVIDRLRYHNKIANQKISDPPIFIIGHWRSGTTYLQKILIKDKQFTSPTFFQCTFPQGFISAEKYLKPIIKKALPPTRIFDAMPFGVDEPFDDEFALLKLTSSSRMLHFVFPEVSSFNKHNELYKFNTECWSTSFMFFAKKITWATRKRIIFKSPMNTLRIKEIIKLFPNAKFIYVHRNPEDVFVSSLFQAEKLFKHNKLHKNKTNVREFVLSRYQALLDEYEKSKKVIPSSQLIEIRFKSLETSPIKVTRSIYDKLEIKGFEKALPNIKNYLEINRNYQKNTYKISSHDQALVYDRWAKAYELFDYKKRMN